MPFNPAIDAAFKIASQYGARPDEKKVFAAAWKWRTKVDKLYKDEHKNIEAEIKRQIKLVADAVKSGRAAGELGHRHIYRGPTKGHKYVIFSDHHWSDMEHRQNFFGLSGNRELYCDILDQYFDEGYTVIENGDVEELIIFEPTVDEIEHRAGLSEEALRRYRHDERRKLLQRIIDDPQNARLYATLRKFHDDGRFVRTVGNHDYDLQHPPILETFRQAFPGIAPPYDYAFLESEGQVKYVVTHGHQFDAATNPVYAPKGGETISESMSWAYQGPDRNWAWQGHGAAWAYGLVPFNNVLVSDDYVKNRGGIFDKISLVLGSLHSKDAWEAIFKHPIAWEYFENTDPQRAMDEEVRTGKQWFKFRHMDELNLMTELNKHFTADRRPHFVLGHTHEVRFHPGGRPATSEYPWIFNTGAAGRFLNLIWGLEIYHGRPRLVSWNRRSPRVGEPERHVYTREDNPPFKLWASKKHVPLKLESATLRSGRTHRVVVDFDMSTMRVTPGSPGFFSTGTPSF